MKEFASFHMDASWSLGTSNGSTWSGRLVGIPVARGLPGLDGASTGKSWAYSRFQQETVLLRVPAHQWPSDEPTWTASVMPGILITFDAREREDCPPAREVHYRCDVDAPALHVA